MKGHIVINSWAGRKELPVVKVGETKTKYRVQLAQDSILPGRNRQGKQGDIILVPKDAFRFDSKL